MEINNIEYTESELKEINRQKNKFMFGLLPKIFWKHTIFLIIVSTAILNLSRYLPLEYISHIDYLNKVWIFISILIVLEVFYTVKKISKKRIIFELEKFENKNNIVFPKNHPGLSTFAIIPYVYCYWIIIFFTLSVFTCSWTVQSYNNNESNTVQRIIEKKKLTKIKNVKMFTFQGGSPVKTHLFINYHIETNDGKNYNLNTPLGSTTFNLLSKRSIIFSKHFNNFKFIEHTLERAKNMQPNEWLPICDVTFKDDVSDPYCDEGLSHSSESIINSLVKDFNKKTKQLIFN